MASGPSAQTAKSYLTSEQEKQFWSWVGDREKRIPLAYLLGDVFFHSLKLKVRPGCLVPRPETVLLVEKAAAVMREEKIENPMLLDVGTGSGAIALALLAEFSQGQVVMIDFSADALEIARENAAELGFLNRAKLIHSDLFSNITAMKGQFDLIVSNPPYITDNDMEELQPEVIFEPRMALAGGKDGLDFYRKIIAQAKKFLKPRGWLGFELGAGQATAVCEELKRYGYEDLRVFRDQQQIERVILAGCALAQKPK